jgi:hypothetical protein
MRLIGRTVARGFAMKANRSKSKAYQDYCARWGVDPESHPNRPTSDSIKGFCERWGINPSTFYRHPELMPRTIKVAGQRLILDADEQEWIEQQRQGRAA